MINAQSLPSSIDTFRDFFAKESYNLIAVTESWLKPHIFDASVSLDNYFILRHDRTFSKGGGVCVYVYNSLIAKSVETSGNMKSYPEFMMVEISHDSTRLLLCLVYRPPRIRHFDTFVDAFGAVSHFYTDILVMGDFNINMLASNQCNFVASQDLFLVPSNATHHTATSDTWLDLVIVDNLEKVRHFQQSGTPFISGDEIISLDYTFDCNPVSNYSFNFRDFEGFNVDAYLDTLQHLLLTSTSFENCDDFIDFLSECLNSSLNQHAPLKTYHSKRPPAPWITLEIKNHLKLRETLRNRLR